MSENLLTEKRFLDLSKQADRRGIVTFSDFLTLNELNIFHQNTAKYVTGAQASGGYEFAERQIVAFIPDALYYTWEYPIDCLSILPSHPKFAEELSHRDILGAVMNLGIERGKIGDILVDEKRAYLFCKQEITDYICEELRQIRHTAICCTRTKQDTFDYRPKLQQFEAVIASNRLDNVVGTMANVSRSAASQLIQTGKVFVQGRECTQNTYICKPSDIISIRSVGKFRFEEEGGMTRKNRMKIIYQKYI